MTNNIYITETRKALETIDAVRASAGLSGHRANTIRPPIPAGPSGHWARHAAKQATDPFANFEPIVRRAEAEKILAGIDQAKGHIFAPSDDPLVQRLRQSRLDFRIDTFNLGQLHGCKWAAEDASWSTLLTLEDFGFPACWAKDGPANIPDLIFDLAHIDFKDMGWTKNKKGELEMSGDEYAAGYVAAAVEIWKSVKPLVQFDDPKPSPYVRD